MANYRRGRINDETVKVVSEIIRTLKDPRLTGALITVTAAEVAPDMKNAKIYFSVLGADMKETKKALTGAGGFIRRELAAKLNLRVTPELTFVPDGSIEYGANISRLINEIHTTQKPYVPKEDETDSEE